MNCTDDDIRRMLRVHCPAASHFAQPESWLARYGLSLRQFGHGVRVQSSIHKFQKWQNASSDYYCYDHFTLIWIVLCELSRAVGPSPTRFISSAIRPDPFVPSCKQIERMQTPMIQFGEWKCLPLHQFAMHELNVDDVRSIVSVVCRHARLRCLVCRHETKKNHRNQSFCSVYT